MSNELLTQLKMAIQDVNRAVENVKNAKDMAFDKEEYHQSGALEQIQSVLELLSKDLFEVSNNYL